MKMSRDLQDVFLANMRSVMKSRGMTLSKLAGMIGVSASLLSQIRSRHRNVGINFLEKVAAALDMEAHELLRPMPGVVPDRRDMRYNESEVAPSIDAKKKKAKS